MFELITNYKDNEEKPYDQFSGNKVPTYKDLRVSLSKVIFLDFKGLVSDRELNLYHPVSYSFTILAKCPLAVAH